ncbi:MAG: hypothetical protein JKZ00_05400 [Flavobacteriaceae bacterium]|nr:hypothetical protein [Flavobacteriaceae bacterium]
MKRIGTLLIAFFVSFSMVSQNDLLDELETDVIIDSTVTSVFKGLKIINMESTKLAAKGDLFFVISHRFGSIKSGIKDLFGLDNSNIRFSFVYGFNNWFNAGVSRSSFNKTYDGHVKYRLLKQEKNKFPVTIVGFNSVEINTNLDEVNYPNLESKHRYTYAHEILISRKFNSNFSLEISPIYLHQNFVENDNQENSQFIVGLGGRYKISKHVALNFEYHAHTNRVNGSLYKDPLSLGVDIQTGGHVFQLHLSNARLMNESGYLTKASGNWGKGDIYFGFNIWRVF